MLWQLREAVRQWARDSILIRPAYFVLAGLAAAWLMLQLDAWLGAAVPQALQFPAGNIRPLYATLAGAALTVAGITFWVRAASVQLAASQYSPRVVHGFLQDWFQQSMMGLLLGIFAYLMSVYRFIPDRDGVSAQAAVPHLAVFVGVALTGLSVVAILGAIRNGVRSMQAGELAHRITDLTMQRIAETLPAATGPATHDEHQVAPIPEGRGHVVRAVDSGWVQRIYERELLAALPPGTTVRVEVRVGLFVVPNRPVLTIWPAAALAEGSDDALRRLVRLGRSRVVAGDIHYGVQQLVDVALGSLWHGTADAGSAAEAIVHLEIVLRELANRGVPPRVSVDDEGRRLLRPREFSFSDYVDEAFDRMRRPAAPHPVVTARLVETLGSVADELEALGRPERLAPLRRHARLLLEAAEAADLLDEELATVRHAGVRHGLFDPPTVPPPPGSVDDVAPAPKRELAEPLGSR